MALQGSAPPNRTENAFFFSVGMSKKNHLVFLLIYCFVFICLWPRAWLFWTCHGPVMDLVSLKIAILESLSQTFWTQKCFHRWCLPIFFFSVFTLFFVMQIALWRNGQKQTKFRSTIDKALEGTYQISTCLLRYLTDKSYFLIFHCAGKWFKMLTDIWVDFRDKS